MNKGEADERIRCVFVFVFAFLFKSSGQMIERETTNVTLMTPLMQRVAAAKVPATKC